MFKQLIKLTVMLYVCFSCIIGCSKLIGTIFPGAINHDQDMIFTEKKDTTSNEMAQVKVSNDTKVGDHIFNPESQDSADIAGSDDLLLDDKTAPQSNHENDSLTNEDKISYENDIDNNNDQVKLTSNQDKALRKSDFNSARITIPPSACTGENVSLHWHELKKVVVVTDLLNIRSHYGSDQSVIGGAKRCEQLLVIDKHVERVRGNKRIKSRGWLKIKTDKGITGWVAGWHTRFVDN